MSKTASKKKVADLVVESKPKAKKAAKKVVEVAIEIPKSRPFDEIIAHLPVRTSMLKHEITELVYNPEVPAFPGAYNEPGTGEETDVVNPSAGGEYAVLPGGIELPENLEAETDETLASIYAEPVELPESTKRAMIDSMIVQFRNRDGIIRVPARTHQHCYWDGHSFNDPPCAIPIREVKRGAELIYEVDHRLFCSPECAAAQIFADVANSFSKWERFALLNSIYKSRYAPGHVIHPAVARDFIDVFGGTFTIGAYRQLCQDGLIQLDLLLPPMIAMNPAVDSKPIDQYESQQMGLFVPIDSEMVDKAATQLRIKRTKPKETHVGALDRCFTVKHA